MKTLLLLGFIIPFTVTGQISLTGNDFADEGDTVRMSTTTDLSIDFSTTGANQTWDYSNLVAEEQYLKEYFDMSNASTFVNVVFGFFASPDYQASYFLPNDDLPLDQVGGILPVPITDVFQFSKKTADSITAVGFAISVDGNEIPFKSDTIETTYKFPLNFMNTYSSRGYTNMDLNPFVDAIWKQYRQGSIEVDGWGSITTPYGTFDALRLHHTISETDSIWFDVLGTGSPFWIPLTLPDNHIYEWWTTGEMEAILRIETSEVLGNEIVSGIEFRDVYLGLAGINELKSSIEIYPNPVNETLQVDGLNESTRYRVLDLSGKTVLVGSTQDHINMSSLLSGQYLLVFADGNEIAPIKFIKE